MNRLPDEILLCIFRKLGIQSLVLCRLVCKRFCFWIDRLALHELVVDNMSKRKPIYWSQQGELIPQQHVLYNFDLKRLLEIPFRLERLRRLYLNCHLKTDEHCDTGSIDYLKLCQLNEFVQLEFLAIHTVRIVYEEILSLPNLKALDIFEISKPDSNVLGPYTFTVNNLMLNAPCLSSVRCEFGLQYLQVLRAESVRELSIADRQTNLSAYAGCEVFRCNWPEAIHKDLLEQLPSLLQLHVDEDDCELFDYQKTCEVIDGLMCQKKRLGRSALAVYFLGNQLDENKRFNDYRFDKLYAVFS